VALINWRNDNISLLSNAFAGDDYAENMAVKDSTVPSTVAVTFLPAPCETFATGVKHCTQSQNAITSHRSRDPTLCITCDSHITNSPSSPGLEKGKERVLEIGCPVAYLNRFCDSCWSSITKSNYSIGICCACGGIYTVTLAAALNGDGGNRGTSLGVRSPLPNETTRSLCRFRIHPPGVESRPTTSVEAVIPLSEVRSLTFCFLFFFFFFC
jgi:hypothetical protein